MKRLVQFFLFLTLVLGYCTVTFAQTVGPVDNITGQGGFQRVFPFNPLQGLLYDQWVDALVLSANTAQTYTIPAGTDYLLFSGTGIFYVSYTGTAVIPSGNVLTGLAPALDPVLRAVTGLTSISVIAPASTIVTISAFR